MTAPNRRAALVFVFVTVTIDVLAFGVIIPVLPHLVQQLVGGDIATATVWTGIFSTAFALAQFICSPIQGMLADRYGRRPVILLSCLGLGLDFLLMAVAQTLPLLLIGRAISGVTAASATSACASRRRRSPPAYRGDVSGTSSGRASWARGKLTGWLKGPPTPPWPSTPRCPRSSSSRSCSRGVRHSDSVSSRCGWA